MKKHYDLRVCHEFDIRPFGHVQGHWEEKGKKCSSIKNVCYRESLKILILYTKIGYDLNVCRDFDPRSFG